MEEATSKLVDELCSLLDEATILSICSDYDLSKPDEFQAARDILLSISQNVEAEEATGFNPSGVGANQIIDIHDAPSTVNEEPRNASENELKSGGSQTTTTESSVPQSLLSSSSSQTSTRDVFDTHRLGLFDGLNDDEKEAALAEMFTLLKPIDIKLALQKAKGDADLACDLLLNTTHLEQTGQRLKGIDGFYVPDDEVSTKKRKGKKKKAAIHVSQPADTSEDPEIAKETNRRNIAYLAERLPLMESDVESLYAQHSSSMGATVVAFLDHYMAALGKESPEFEASRVTMGLAKQFSWVPTKYIASIVEVTGGGRKQAQDLVQVLATFYEKPAYLRYDISYNLSKPETDIESIEGTGRATTTKAWSTVAKTTSSPRVQTPVLRSSILSASDLAVSRDHSFTAANLTFKKGGLYRQAAAVYSERGRELAGTHRHAISAEAAAMVDRSSTSERIDLHGVTVQDGVDIALDRTWRWWNSLGEDRARRAKEGFTIVTGRGRHSADGHSRLRSNVFKALVADGWKVVVLTGEYLIQGRQR